MVQSAKVLQKGSVELEGVTRVASVETERPEWFSGLQSVVESVQFAGHRPLLILFKREVEVALNDSSIYDIGSYPECLNRNLTVELTASVVHYGSATGSHPL